MASTVLNLAPIATLDDEGQFIKLCKANPHLRLERDATGALVVMPPSGGEGSRREVDPLVDLSVWNRPTGLGMVFGPTAVSRRRVDHSSAMGGIDAATAARLPATGPGFRHRGSLAVG